MVFKIIKSTTYLKNVDQIYNFNNMILLLNILYNNKY